MHGQSLLPLEASHLVQFLFPSLMSPSNKLLKFQCWKSIFWISLAQRSKIHLTRSWRRQKMQRKRWFLFLEILVTTCSLVLIFSLIMDVENQCLHGFASFKCRILEPHLEFLSVVWEGCAIALGYIWTACWCFLVAGPLVVCSYVFEISIKSCFESVLYLWLKLWKITLPTKWQTNCKNLIKNMVILL